jgi:alkylation response protein AidB-like acyl-CoA dehydrogenase
VIPGEVVRAQMATDRGYEESTWRQMSQLGLQGLIVPEAYGGAGGTSVDLSVVMEEMGRALLCAPYFSTVVLAAPGLIHSGDEQAKAAHLPCLASGELTATLAYVEADGDPRSTAVETTAVRTEQGWRVTGTKWFVLDGHTADLVLVVARTGAGISLFAVDGAADGVTRTRLETLDPTRKQATLHFQDVSSNVDRSRWCGRRTARAGSSTCGHCPRHRADRGRPAGAEHGRRTCEEPHPVRPADRIVLAATSRQC